MSRGFTLAHEVDDEGAVAKLEGGVLRPTLPKRGGAGSRLVRVQ